MRRLTRGQFRLGGKELLTILALTLFIFVCVKWVYEINHDPKNIELISTSYPGKILIEDSSEVLGIYEELKKASGSGEVLQIKGNYKLNLVTGGGTQTYIFDEPEAVQELSTGRVLRLNDGGECLKPYLQELQAKFRFGRLMPWSQVKKIFPKFAKAKIIDFETGMSFMVQRRAGSRHADVQPLTAEDSAVMKQVYGGKWTWKRRAIIVEVNGYRVAASMNGMPHGAGAIAGNDFDGHFCVHFLDSEVHTNRGGEDLGHQLMAWKAAGRVSEMLSKAGPDRIAAAMLTALAQADVPLTMELVEASPGTDLAETARRLTKVRTFAIVKLERGTNSTRNAVQIEAIVTYRLENGTSKRDYRVLLEVVRVKGEIPWKVTAETVLEMLEG